MKKILYIPRPGARMVKTALAVFICFVIYILRGYKGMVSQSVIAAIICMQPYVSDSRTFAIERISGTILGAFWGLAYLLMMRSVPLLSSSMYVVYALMSIGVILALYSAVLLKQSNSAGLVAIVFLCIVMTYPDIESPLQQTFDRVFDTAIGTLVAIVVNITHLPRRKNEDFLFFVRTQDILPDRYQHMSSPVHFALNSLYKDGAKICLISRWAPAFIIPQLNLLDINTPLIIMDGAGLYDMKENKYLDIIEIPKANETFLRTTLASLGFGCSTYAVHDRTMFIFRSGPLSQAECEEYELMKRSPYRNYINGVCLEEDRVAFMRVIDTSERIYSLATWIRELIPDDMFRIEIREQPSCPEHLGIYFYDPAATVENMKKKVCDYTRRTLNIEPVEKNILPLSSTFSAAHDAASLLSRVKSVYEPVSFFKKHK